MYIKIAKTPGQLKEYDGQLTKHLQKIRVTVVRNYLEKHLNQLVHVGAGVPFKLSKRQHCS